MPLPVDSHVHSEFSWDTGGPAHAAGRMAATISHAERIGLPGLILTEHLDLEPDWRTDPADLPPKVRHLVDTDGVVRTPAFDQAGYLDSIERCRGEHPDVLLLTGLEFGQPHLRWAEAAAVLELSLFDRINGSLHTIEHEGHRYEPNTLYRLLPADEVVRLYLAELVVMAGSDAGFTTVTHLDYAAQYWPIGQVGPFDPRRFEGEIRAAMRAIAASGRALEMNTRVLWPWMPRWWAQEGGRMITFGSDAHLPEDLARGFPDVVEMVEALGFRPGPALQDPWVRQP